MKYIHNGKEITIPDDELARNMKALDLTKEEAIELYIDDLETTDKKSGNAESEALTQKAKTNGVQRDMCSVSGGKVGVKKTVERPLDVDKIDLINSIAEWLESEGYDNVDIMNPTKIVEFDLGEDRYAIDLIRRTKKTMAKRANQNN